MNAARKWTRPTAPVAGSLSTVLSALLLALAVVLGLVVGPAAAHSGFESSEPGDGSTATEPVGEIVIRFTGAVEPAAEGFVVLEPSGVIREPDDLVAEAGGRVWILRFDPPLAGGPVGVRWAAKASDTHTISGSFSFQTPPTEAAPGGLEPNDPAADADTTTAGTAPTTDDGEPVSEAAGADQPVAVPPGVSDAAEAVAAAGGADGLAADRLEAFLADVDRGPTSARILGTAARGLTMAATMVALGGIAFVATVLRDRAKDAYSVLNGVRLAGWVLGLGAIVELTAQLAVSGGSWTAVADREVVESTVMSMFGAAIGLRFLAGLWLAVSADVVMLAAVPAPAKKAAAEPVAEREAEAEPEAELVGAGVGGGSSTVSLGRAPVRSAFAAMLAADGDLDATPVPTADLYPPRALDPARLLAGLTLLLSFTFDGHTAQVGTHWLMAIIDMVHVAAGAIWGGGVLALAIVLWSRRRRGLRPEALQLAVRFSVVAALALVAAGIAGGVLTVMILDRPGELVDTPWGRLLLAKVAAVTVAAVSGGYNHFVVIPWMRRQPDDDRRPTLLRRTVTAEAVALLIVVIVTAVLVGAAS